MFSDFYPKPFGCQDGLHLIWDEMFDAYLIIFLFFNPWIQDLQLSIVEYMIEHCRIYDFHFLPYAGRRPDAYGFDDISSI